MDSELKSHFAAHTVCDTVPHFRADMVWTAKCDQVIVIDESNQINKYWYGRNQKRKEFLLSYWGVGTHSMVDAALL